MKKLVNLFVNFGVNSGLPEMANQRIRFANIIALIHVLFIILIFNVLLIQYGFKNGAKLVALSTIIPLGALSLNYFSKTLSSRYWLTFANPLMIMAISIYTKVKNPTGYTGFYEFFDTRMLVFTTVIIPLLLFSRKNLGNMLIALLPSALLLFFYDPIHTFFNVGYTNIFTDAKGGYYIAGILFDVSYLFAVLGILSLKKSNETLVQNNAILIGDLNNKNKIQEKLLIRKQELLLQNRKVSEDLLVKQGELINNKNDLERATELINYQNNELEYKNKELLTIVNERTRELKQANEELIVQNNGLLQFSNTVSHNLRAPVASLLGLVHLFTIETDEQRKNDMVGLIQRATEALDTIIGDLNKVVDMRNQLLNLKENFKISDEIEKVRLLLIESLKKADIAFKTHIEKDEIYAIRSYIQSVLYNLINNAIKYANPEGNREILVSSVETDTDLEIKIQDNGIGIDTSKFKNDLFKMYKRFHTHVDGKGMGLYIVKQQVEAMGGSISVNSRVSQGTVFTLSFPIKSNIEEQEYFSSDDAILTYEAHTKTSYLKWHRTPDGEVYRNICNTNKEMFFNYDATTWLVDIRKLGIINESYRNWFASKVLNEILKQGCKHIILVRSENDGKDFDYWKHMIDIAKKMDVEFDFMLDEDSAWKLITDKMNTTKA